MYFSIQTSKHDCHRIAYTCTKLALSCRSSFETNADPDQLVSEKPVEQHTHFAMGVQWLSGRVLDARSKGFRFKPHRGHLVESLSEAFKNPA